MSFLSEIFKFVVAIRNKAYDWKIISKFKTKDVFVISVGNLSTGGNGKTVLSIYICQMLNNLGYKTAYISRGYKGRFQSRGALISDGKNIIINNPKESGDEALEASLKLNDVTVRVGKNRKKQIILSEKNKIKVVVLDDAFQHRQVHRNLDIVMVSPDDLDKNTRFLPAGCLREPASSLSRADITGGFFFDWKDEKPPPDFLIDYSPAYLWEKPGIKKSTTSILKIPVFVAAGIARPDRFLRTCERAGFSVKNHKFFNDHYCYTKKDVENLILCAQKMKAKIIVTTSKDMVKIMKIINAQDKDFLRTVQIYALEINMEFTKGKDEFKDMLISKISKYFEEN